MASYVVTWTINLDDERPEFAALQALDIQRDPESLATCFTVTDEATGVVAIVDTDVLPKAPRVALGRTGSDEVRP